MATFNHLAEQGFLRYRAQRFQLLSLRQWEANCEMCGLRHMRKKTFRSAGEIRELIINSSRMIKRPHIPLAIKRAAALRQLAIDPATSLLDLKGALRMLGLSLEEAELDHNPALALRRAVDWDADGAEIEWDPPANDPRYLYWVAKGEHRQKTHGRKHTSYGSDAHAIAKSRRIADRLRVVEGGKRSRWPSRPIPSRPFPSRA